MLHGKRYSGIHQFRFNTSSHVNIKIRSHPSANRYTRPSNRPAHVSCLMNRIKCSSNILMLIHHQPHTPFKAAKILQPIIPFQHTTPSLLTQRHSSHILKHSPFKRAYITQGIVLPKIPLDTRTKLHDTTSSPRHKVSHRAVDHQDTLAR